MGNNKRCPSCGRYWFSLGLCRECAEDKPRAALCILGEYIKKDRFYVYFKVGRHQRIISMSRSRLIAAVKIGRPLLATEIVHHSNEDPLDDSFDNLVVLPSKDAHAKVHKLGIDGVRRRDAGRLCAGCGCGLDERTRGCLTCCNRHRRRQLSGTEYAPAALGAYAFCSRCGIQADERTHGCETCRQRHYLRRKKKEKKS